MRALIVGGLSFAMLAAPPASAEVKSATDQGFAIASEAVVAAPPAAAYEAFGRIGAWWSSDHSYSHDAPANMTIDLRPGGCFCETLPGGGGVEHMRVVYVDPGKAVRLAGGLGPAQAMGVAGALTWTFAPSGTGTRISASYMVGGYLGADPRTLAPIFDRVLGEQVARLKAYIEAHPAASGERRRP